MRYIIFIMCGESMFKKRFSLSQREQRVMELLWDNPDGLTSVDIYEQLDDIMVNPTYAHRTINSLLEKNLITDHGTVRYNKQYARNFIPTMSREELGAGMLLENGIGLSSLSDLAASLIQQDSSPASNKDEIIKELKKIIKTLKED